MRFIIFILGLFLCFGESYGKVAPVTVQNTPALKKMINWDEFLSRNDMTWTSMPKSWQEAPFLGNGELGLLVYGKNNNEIKFELGHGRAQDQRDFPEIMQGSDNMLYRGRLMVGSFYLKTKGTIKGCDWRLDLSKAELSGSITTDKGAITIRAYVHASTPLIIIEAIPEGGEEVNQLKWGAETAVSTRLLSHKRKPGEPEFVKSPDPTLVDKDKIQIWEQKVKPNYCLTTAWSQEPYKKASVYLPTSPTAKTVQPSANKATKQSKQHSAKMRLN